MKTFDNKPVDQWHDHDKMIFALAGISRVAADALKENLNPPYGWADDYPERLESSLLFWLNKITELKTGTNPVLNSHDGELGVGDIG